MNKNETTKEKFYIGATYAPLAKATEVDISEWESDIKKMAGLGLTTFRLFVAWDRIEQKEGVLDFSRVDHSFDLAERYGLKVIVNTGGTFVSLQGIYPPRWLHTHHGCALHSNVMDEAARSEGTRVQICYDDPVYLLKAETFIRTVIRRYRGRACLHGWSIWNEPRVHECFCPCTLARFRDWLREKYGTLEQLSAAWSTEFPLAYEDWSEVKPQRNAGFEHGGYLPRVDWRTFCRNNLSAKFETLRRWVKEEDPNHPTLSHHSWPGISDLFGGEDILGVSIYSYFHQRDKRYEFPDGPLLDELCWMSSLMRLGKRKGRQLEDGFYVVETEAGPTAWVHTMMPRYYSGRKMNARDMVFVGHGAKAILRWLYRSRVTDAQAGEFNLVGWDGTITERAQEFGVLASRLNNHASLLSQGIDPSASVALLCNTLEDEELLQVEEIQDRYWMHTWNHWYNSLRHAHYLVDVLNDRQIFEDALTRYRVLVVPFRPYVSAALAEKLKAFVERGGTLIAESPFAIKDQNARHWQKTPGSGLHEIFGASVYDLEKVMDHDITNLPCLDFKARLHLHGAQVLHTFADGQPSCLSHRAGKGRAILYASIVSQPYEWSSGGEFRRQMATFLSDAGVEPEVVLHTESPERTPEIGLFWRKLSETERLLIVVNFSASAHQFALNLPLGARVAATLVNEGGAVSIDQNQIELHASPFGWWMLKVDKTPSPTTG